MLGNISKNRGVFSIVEMKQTSSLLEPQKCPTVRKKKTKNTFSTGRLPLLSPCNLSHWPLSLGVPLRLPYGTDCKTILCSENYFNSFFKITQTTQNMPNPWRSVRVSSVLDEVYTNWPRFLGFYFKKRWGSILKQKEEETLFSYRKFIQNSYLYFGR